MRNRFWLSSIVALTLLCLYALPVLAISNPSSVNILKTHATQNVLQTGDILFLAEYEVNYGSTPSESIDEAFIFQLLATDGTTELGRVLAFPYVTLGYGKGVISFYFNNSTAPGTDQYIIRILGNPAVFSTPYSQDFAMPSSTYTALSSNSSTDIALQVRIYADDLYASYEPVLGSSLIATTGTSISLSGVGEIYFTNAIPNLRNMSPALFEVGVYAPVASADSYNTTQADAYKDRFVGNWVADSTTAAGTLLNTDMQIAMGVVIVFLCVLWAVAAAGLTGKAEIGFLPMVSTVLGGTLLGFMSMAVTSVIVFIAALYIGVVLIFKAVQP